MKTFVAEDVLRDYTPGLIVVKAEDKEEAIKIIMKELSTYLFIDDCVGDKNCREYGVIEGNIDCLRCKLRELKDNELVYVYGGG
ncbi:hypothetical protein [Ferrimicrobium sp.]|uniref:hypothetical protein n=1 Tax=Ferrimicrobium sp. TaxID=2926050 RepID=UPI00262FE60F|nr:hypothetical protein [Ferrimicrobium sp.]